MFKDEIIMAMWREKLLGLTIEERSIKVAEVRSGVNHGRIIRVAEFVFSEELTWDDPLPLGTAFAGFLREHGFTIGNAVVGVPARWLVSKEKAFPKVDPVSLVGMVRLEAEQSFAIPQEQLLYDYTEFSFDNRQGESGLAAGDRKTMRVFIAAMHRRKSDQITTMLAKAGLQARTMTPTVLPAAVTVKPDQEDGLFFFIKPDYVEMVLRESGVVRMLRHLPGKLVIQGDKSNQAIGIKQVDLVNEARKIMANLSTRHGSSGFPFFLCNETIMDDDKLLHHLAGQLTVPLSIVGGTGDSGTAAASFISAEEGKTIAQKLFTTTAALAEAGVNGCDFSIDFLHSRLREKQTGISSRTWVRGGIVLGIPVLIVIFLAAGWYFENRRLTALREQVAEIGPRKNTAERFWQRFETYLAWTDRRPLFLEPLREVALAIPREERVWLTSLTVREDMQIVLVGKANNEQIILETLDRLRQGGNFKQVKMLYLRESGNETTFSISLTFIQ